MATSQPPETLDDWMVRQAEKTRSPLVRRYMVDEAARMRAERVARAMEGPETLVERVWRLLTRTRPSDN